jgi:hypothetical protein
VTKTKKALIASSLLACLLAVSAQTQKASQPGNSRAEPEITTQPLTMPLDSMDGLEVKNVRESVEDLATTKVEIASYQGRRALRLVNDRGLTALDTPAGSQSLAIVQTSEFKDGTIEADVAGLPRKGTSEGVRGFVGIAFHVQDQGSRYEAFFLRMTNGRAEDQLRRNHSTQYVQQPDFTWKRLRDEDPGVYESYVDLDADAWTRIKIVVAGTKARLYVNGAAQPCLIVNDLKMGATHGEVALFAGWNTDAYFSNLTVR